MSESTEKAPESAAKATTATPPRDERKCSVEGCKRPYRAKTYCVVHYQAWRRGEIEAHKTRYKLCSKEACKKPSLRSPPLPIRAETVRLPSCTTVVLPWTGRPATFLSPPVCRLCPGRQP